MIKVLVVDDSAVAREFITHLLSADSSIKVVGAANNGEESLEAVRQMKPDVITMDISMPKMNGIEATRLIMEQHPTPIVIVSGNLNGDHTASFRAVEAGALAVLARPMGIDHRDHAAAAQELTQTVKLMSEVRVVRRWSRSRQGATVNRLAPHQVNASKVEISLKRPATKIKIIAIGASTGGPLALQQILSGLPKNFPAAILIVQHIAAGFVQGFAEWLAQSAGLPVHVALDGEPVLPGRVYVAPDGLHLEIQSGDRISLRDGEPENGLRPSVSALFRSVAHVAGAAAVGVLLTGMGRDGADELKLMRDRGAITIAQDKESSVIHGMPGEAIKLGGATHVLPPQGITSMLASLPNPKSE